MFVLIVSSPAFAGPALSDSEARAIYEDHYKDWVTYLDLGEFAVVSGKADIAKRTVSPGTYENMVNWEKVGLVEVLEDEEYKNFRSGKGGWSVTQWMQLTQEDVQKKIAVTVTERGKQYLHGDGDLKTKLRIPMGKLTVTKIVKNEERRKGVDDYRVIMMTYDSAWSPVYMEYLLASGRKSLGSRVIALFQFDPFESKWKLKMMDIAGANGVFSSDGVGRYLAQ
jgi:hypothetical protein